MSAVRRIILAVRKAVYGSGSQDLFGEEAF